MNWQHYHRDTNCVSVNKLVDCTCKVASVYVAYDIDQGCDGLFHDYLFANFYEQETLLRF